MTNKTFPIQLYKTPDGAVQMDVRLQDDTLWLNQQQMADIFGVRIPAISKHLKNIFAEEELSKEATVSILEIVQTEGDRKIKRNVEFYNLDAIIAVWYRVNSKQATHFRIWATNVIKEHIIKWYTINQERLLQTGIADVQKTLAIVKRAVEAGELSYDESQGLLQLITDYVPSLITLHHYDNQTLTSQWQTSEEKYHIDTDEAYAVLAQLKDQLMDTWEASELFAFDRNTWLASVFGTIYQWFDGKDVYPTVEEKAANLLYLIIKNHPFADGNKRSGAFLFVWYLHKNGILDDIEGKRRINEQTLVALALFVATSDPQEKDLIVKLIVQLLQ